MHRLILFYEESYVTADTAHFNNHDITLLFKSWVRRTSRGRGGNICYNIEDKLCYTMLQFLPCFPLFQNACHNLESDWRIMNDQIWPLCRQICYRRWSHDQILLRHCHLFLLYFQATNVEQMSCDFCGKRTRKRRRRRTWGEVGEVSEMRKRDRRWWVYF